jgi:glyoxylase-like metal-dependent hydrolase (beta-lactamase superfamily II)
MIKTTLFNATLLFVALTSVASSKKTYPAVDVLMEPVRLSEHVYYVQGMAGAATENAGFISNAAFIITDDSIVMFDALGSPSLAAKLLKKIRTISDKPITKVIVSHYHADHIYGLQVFKELGAEILASDGAFKYIGSPQAEERLEERRFSLEPWVSESTKVLSPDVVIEKDTPLTVGGVELHINYLGDAHSDGDLALYVVPDKVLLSGDIIFEGRVPFVGSANTKRWLEVLTNLETQGLHALLPGHGPAAKKPNKAISLTRRYLEALRTTMQQAVEDLTPFAEAYQQADWSEFSALPAFSATHRRNAYQVYLSLEAEELNTETDN